MGLTDREGVTGLFVSCDGRLEEITSCVVSCCRDGRLEEITGGVVGTDG